MGDDEIRRAAESSNRLLKSPVKALQEGGLSEGSKVGGTLLELRRTVEELDPKGAQGSRRILGMIPFGDRLTDYFRKYQSRRRATSTRSCRRSTTARTSCAGTTPP